MRITCGALIPVAYQFASVQAKKRLYQVFTDSYGSAKPTYEKHEAWVELRW
jgi:hypothetical protein